MQKDREGCSLGLVPMILLEALVLLCAGLAFVAGIRGTIVAVFMLSILNWMMHDSAVFWRWEIPLIIGAVLGIGVLFGLNRKAGRSNFTTGFVGGIISLVVFAAFITPILAVVIWLLIFGTGLIPAPKKGQVAWGLAPSAWRLLLGVAFIIYGNFLAF